MREHHPKRRGSRSYTQARRLCHLEGLLQLQFLLNLLFPGSTALLQTQRTPFQTNPSCLRLSSMTIIVSSYFLSVCCGFSQLIFMTAGNREGAVEKTAGFDSQRSGQTGFGQAVDSGVEI